MSLCDNKTLLWGKKEERKKTREHFLKNFCIFTLRIKTRCLSDKQKDGSPISLMS